MDNQIVGREISNSISVTNLLNGRSVATIQQPYLLTEADYERLKGSQPITSAMATIVFSGVVGYAVGLGPKITPMFESKASELTSGEIKTIVGFTLIAVVLYVIGFAVPNGKKKTMKKIARHFDSAPASAHIVGGAE
jgi:hypothetical protein